MKKLLLLCLSLILIPQICFGAIHADTVWECRADATANNVNGGGYNASNASAGTDFSQQETAEDNGTDLAIDAVDNTIVTSATHNFVAADNGNIIHITAGTGFTAGWYEIASTASNAATLDRACGTVGSTNGTWYLGGAISLASALDDEFIDTLVAGNTVWIEEGTYTLSETASSATNGTATSVITIEGYKTTRGDNPTGTDRPTIACGGYGFYPSGNYWIMRNLIYTGTGSSLAKAPNYGLTENCKSTQSSATADRHAFSIDSPGYSSIISCEAESTNGHAIEILGYSTNLIIIGCYIHDSENGIEIQIDSKKIQIVNNIIDTCAIGVATDPGEFKVNIIGNTIYNCTTGIDFTDNGFSVIVNNIIDNCTTGATQSAEQKNNWWDYNCWDNTTDTSNVTWGSHRVEGDPGMTDPANGDFTLGSGSNCLDTGLQVGTNQGATGDYKVNIGADQDDVTAAAAGGGAFGWWGRQ